MRQCKVSRFQRLAQGFSTIFLTVAFSMVPAGIRRSCVSREGDAWRLCKLFGSIVRISSPSSIPYWRGECATCCLPVCLMRKLCFYIYLIAWLFCVLQNSSSSAPASPLHGLSGLPVLMERAASSGGARSIRPRSTLHLPPEHAPPPGATLPGSPWRAECKEIASVSMAHPLH